MSNKNLDNRLKQKPNKEYSVYLNGLTQKSKEKIIKSAYQLAVKNELKNELLLFLMNSMDKKIAIKYENLFEELYNSLLHTDIPLEEILHFSMIETMAKITRAHGRKDNIEKD